MDFDREYNKTRRPGNEEDFTDSNVQALVEGRRKKALPRPSLLRPATPAPVGDRNFSSPPYHLKPRGFC